MIDLHTHLLPGIDDGPSSLADAVAMARIAVEAGSRRTIVCTPHVHPSYPDITPEVIHRGVAELREALAAEEVPLEILPGAEISLDRLPVAERPGPRALTLGRGDWLLLELPFHGWPFSLPQMLYDLKVRGFGGVLPTRSGRNPCSSRPTGCATSSGAGRSCRSPPPASPASTARGPSGRRPD